MDAKSRGTVVDLQYTTPHIWDMQGNSVHSMVYEVEHVGGRIRRWAGDGKGKGKGRGWRERVERMRVREEKKQGDHESEYRFAM